jgi:hypothetical protein
MKWMNIEVFDDFTDFLFITNQQFDKVDSYYSLVKKPFAPDDIANDFELRRDYCAKAIGIIFKESSKTV